MKIGRKSGRSKAAGRGCFLANLKSRWMTAVRHETPSEGDIYEILDKQGERLGYVNYYPRWKHWVFEPRSFLTTEMLAGAQVVLFDRCLLDLSNFLSELNGGKG